MPLSLHKSLDLAVVCFKPEQIDDFSLEWAKLDVLKHNTDWRKYEEGEADAFVSDRGWFIIGDKEQLPEDFDREIKSKVETIMPFEEAWKKAIEYVKSFSKTVLLNQQKFYEEVYKKVRDIFVDILLGKQKPPRQEALK